MLEDDERCTCDLTRCDTYSAVELAATLARRRMQSVSTLTCGRVQTATDEHNGYSVAIEQMDSAQAAVHTETPKRRMPLAARWTFRNLAARPSLYARTESQDAALSRHRAMIEMLPCECNQISV